jgi:uncharacterized phage protein (TIGR02218 family)
MIADGELTSIVLCWRLERTDGAGVALTSHDAPIVRDMVAYDPAPGLTPATISRQLGVEPHSSEVSGSFNCDGISEMDLELGRWNGAATRLTAVDWADPQIGAIDLLAGTLGRVGSNGDDYSAELDGAAVRLEEPVCPATSPECRAELGDKSCRIDLAARSRRAKVIASEGASLTLDTELDEAFVLGRLRYLSGGNCGLETIVFAVDGAAVDVRDLPPTPVESNCTVEVREGCDKTFATCCERFANAANFRGEPHLPGSDLLTRYPGA